MVGIDVAAGSEHMTHEHRRQQRLLSTMRNDEQGRASSASDVQSPPDVVSMDSA